MTEQDILSAVQDIFRDNFDDDSLVITRETCADDIEDWDSLEQINLLTAIEMEKRTRLYRFVFSRKQSQRHLTIHFALS